MYNRYIPNGLAYTRVLEEDAPPFSHPRHQNRPQDNAPRQEPHPEEPHPEEHDQEPHRRHSPDPPPWDGAPGDKKPSFLSGFLKLFKLDALDTGDILLLLILLFLVLDGDGDNLELIITLGLVILFSLGDKDHASESDAPSKGKVDYLAMLKKLAPNFS